MGLENAIVWLYSSPVTAKRTLLSGLKVQQHNCSDSKFRETIKEMRVCGVEEVVIEPD